MKQLKVFLNLLLLVIMPLLITSCSCSNVPLTGARYITYLVDTSGSFLPLQQADIQALTNVSDEIINKSITNSEPPVFFYWTPITEYSVDANGLCGGLVEYDPALLQRGKHHYNNKKKLRTWHEACIENRLRSGSIKRAIFTDISGALRAVSEATNNISGGKLTVILSDFIEDLPSKRTNMEYKLNNHSVIMLYRAGKQIKQDQALYTRLDDFVSRLEEAGASKVCRASVRGFTASSVAACI